MESRNKVHFKRNYPVIVFFIAEFSINILRLCKFINSTRFLELNSFALFLWAILEARKTYQEKRVDATKVLIILGIIQFILMFFWEHI